MLTLDVEKLSDDQLAAAREAHRELRQFELQGFSRIHDDPQRRRLDRMLWEDMLRIEIDELAKSLQLEPLMTVRH